MRTCFAEKLAHSTWCANGSTDSGALQVLNMVLQFEVLREQLRDVTTLLSSKPLILEHSGNIGHTKSRPSNEYQRWCSIVLGSLPHTRTKGGKHCRSIGENYQQ